MADYENKYPDKENLDTLLEKVKDYTDEKIVTRQPLINSDNKLLSDNVDDTNQDNKFVTSQEKQTWNNKQDELIDGYNIKTINNESLLGSGNINIVTDISGKADKVAGATAGDFAGLDASGNLVDSGKKASDFATPSDLTNETNARIAADALKQDKCTILYDTEVSNWVSDSTYTGYDYKADITVSGVTVSDVAIVSFGGNELISGNYLGLCVTNNGSITIYSKVNTTITIPNIVIIKNLRDLQQVQNVSVSGTDVTFDTIPNATSYEVLIDGVSIGEEQA